MDITIIIKIVGRYRCAILKLRYSSYPRTVCSARFLLLNIHPVGVGVIFYVIAFFGLFYSVSFILKTGCTDPGIIPRARPDEIDYMISLGDVGKPL